MRKALIVGIDYYAHANRLGGCVNDAYSVRQVLERHGDGTKNFDVLSYRQRLGRMASDKQLGEMEWADFVKGTQKCRGYFTMLMAVECLYVDVTGRSVTLCTARPYHPGDISKKIKDIVPRFMLEQNGVILEGEEIQCAL